MILIAGQAYLLQIVLALDPIGRFSDLLHRRQKQSKQNRNDGDHHQKLDQRKGFTSHRQFPLKSFPTLSSRQTACQAENRNLLRGILVLGLANGQDMFTNGQTIAC
jgi:hypothetical protein